MKTLTRQKILKHLESSQPISPKLLTVYLKISRQALFRHLDRLLKEEKIQKEGRPPKVQYFLKKTVDLFKIAWKWNTNPTTASVPSDWYCQTRDVFSARSQVLLSNLERKEKAKAYLLTAVVGEIGNNSFDHNLGHWPDLPGIFFAYDLNQKIIILSDRGVGLLKTIQGTLPTVTNDQQALKTAFTKIVSGRFPEKRGNGLKFVKQVIKENNWILQFFSGTAGLEIRNQNLSFKEIKPFVYGCLAVLKY